MAFSRSFTPFTLSSVYIPPELVLSLPFALAHPVLSALLSFATALLTLGFSGFLVSSGFSGQDGAFIPPASPSLITGEMSGLSCSTGRTGITTAQKPCG